MVKIERSMPAPASLAIEKQKASGSYSKDDVVFRLEADFHGKCYICEEDKLQSLNVEHLHPHHGGKDRDLMFDWNNLFYCCAHCNRVKNQAKFEENILDCCVIDPEDYLEHAFEGKYVQVTPKVKTIEATTTAALITACFEDRHTAVRKIESQHKVESLQKTLSKLYKALDLYRTNRTDQELRVVRGMLSRNHKFAGFIRGYVRSKLSVFPELAEYLSN